MFFISRVIVMPRAWNAMMFANLTIGQGMFVAFYALEWYALRKCKPYFVSLGVILNIRVNINFQNDWRDAVVARTFVCYDLID